jgi:hypothetical protein
MLSLNIINRLRSICSLNPTRGEQVCDEGCVRSRVNSGDRHAAITEESDQLAVGWIREPVQQSVDQINRLRSICSLNPTAHSAALINVELGGGLIRALDALRRNNRIAA